MKDGGPSGGVSDAGEAEADRQTAFAGHARLHAGCRQRILDVRKEEALAPAVGFEPTANRLTVDCSTTELRRIRAEAAL